MLESAIGDFLDDSDVVAEIVMLRAAETKAILVLEGESDRKLLSFFVRSDRCDLVVAHGREKVLLAIAAVRIQHIEGVLCVIDSDYDEFLGKSEAADDVIVTGEHDMETILLKPSSLTKLLSELASSKKIERLSKSGLNVFDLIVHNAVDLGALRLHSRMNGDYLKFRGLKLRSLDRRTFSFKWDDLLNEVVGHSSKPHLPKAPITLHVAALKASAGQPHRLCCGHDLTAILGRALQSVIGTLDSVEATADAIERHLRIGFSAADFQATNVYSEIKAWEGRHAPFVVLK